MSRSPLSLDAVLANGELERRPARRPDAAAEARALALLDEALARSPESVLQKVADAALALCSAGSAGVSLPDEDNGRPMFRWRAVAGAFARHFGAAMPSEHSPSGTVLERGAPQLMVCPERYFTPLLELKPSIVEALLVPVRAEGRAIGTLWVLSHAGERRFTREDRRVLETLSTYAAAARV